MHVQCSHVPSCRSITRSLLWSTPVVTARQLARPSCCSTPGSPQLPLAGPAAGQPLFPRRELLRPAAEASAAHEGRHQRLQLQVSRIAVAATRAGAACLPHGGRLGRNRAGRQQRRLRHMHALPETAPPSRHWSKLEAAHKPLRGPATAGFTTGACCMTLQPKRDKSHRSYFIAYAEAEHGWRHD